MTSGIRGGAFKRERLSIWESSMVGRGRPARWRSVDRKIDFAFLVYSEATERSEWPRLIVPLCARSDAMGTCGIIQCRDKRSNEREVDGKEATKITLDAQSEESWK